MVFLKRKRLRPIKLGIDVNPAIIIADGQSTSQIILKLFDNDGKLTTAFDDIEVILTTTSGKITSPIIFKKNSSTTKAILTSSLEVGKAKVKAESKGLEGVNTEIEFTTRGKIRITPERTVIPATGTSTIKLKIDITDRAENPITSPEDITISLSSTSG